MEQHIVSQCVSVTIDTPRPLQTWVVRTLSKTGLANLSPALKSKLEAEKRANEAVGAGGSATIYEAIEHRRPAQAKTPIEVYNLTNPFSTPLHLHV